MALLKNPYKQFEGAKRSLSDELAIDRTLLANERTLLAYARTALAFGAAGATALQLMAGWQAWVTGLPFLALAAVVAVLGSWRAWSVQRRVRTARQQVDAPKE
jgi:putative membrane protein